MISDEAGIIKDTAVVESQAAKLVDQGIMPHVVTVQNLAKYGTRLADVETAYETSCPNWLGANHKRVGNLLVIIVAPNSKLKNAFLGDALAPAFGSSSEVDSVLSKAANPYFRSGQFAGGIAAAMKDFNSKNIAYHDQANHPAQSTTIINQGDGTASSHAVEWVFGLLFLAGFVGFLVWYLRKRNQDKEEVEEAQQSAKVAQSRATNAFRNADSSNSGYADIAAQFTDLSNSVTYDPNSGGMSAASYRAMEKAWDTLGNDIRRLRTPSVGTLSSVEDSSAPKATASSRYTVNHDEGERVHHHYEAPAQPTVIHETTVVHDNSGDMLTGMLIGEAISDRDDRRRDRDEEPSYSSPSYSEPEREEPSSGSDSSWSSSDDDSSSSGSDSSWSSDSSSSDSSSSFDSGSSGSDSSW